MIDSFALVPESVVEKTIFPPLNCLGTPVKNELSINVKFISGLPILFHLCMSVLMLIKNTVIIAATL